MYGFLGFSYPLEDADCSAASNGYDGILADLKIMKETFGATMVRVYAPECRDASLWENLVRACMEVGMGLIVQVWWGFSSDSEVRFLPLSPQSTGMVLKHHHADAVEENGSSHLCSL